MKDINTERSSVIDHSCYIEFEDAVEAGKNFSDTLQEDLYDIVDMEYNYSELCEAYKEFSSTLIILDKELVKPVMVNVLADRLAVMKIEKLVKKSSSNSWDYVRSVTNCLHGARNLANGVVTDILENYNIS